MSFWKKRGEEYKEERLRTASDEAVSKKSNTDPRRKFLTLSASHVRNLSKSHNDLLDVTKTSTFERQRRNTEDHSDQQLPEPNAEVTSLPKRMLRYSVKDFKLFENESDSATKTAKSKKNRSNLLNISFSNETFQEQREEEQQREKTKPRPFCRQRNEVFQSCIQWRYSCSRILIFLFHFCILLP
jgi:hypothetical protein